MTATSAASPAEGLEALAKGIREFEPDEVAGELDPILHNGRYSLLSTTIVEFHGEQIGPVTTVLDSLGTAISEVEVRVTRSALSLEAGKAVIGALEHKDFQAGSCDSVEAIAEKGHGFIGLSGDAKDQIGLLCDLSTATAKANVAGPVSEDTVYLFEQAGSYLDEAAELASGLESGSDRIRNLALIAEDSLENYYPAAVVLQGGGHRLDLRWMEQLESLGQQPIRLYNQAIAARNDVEANMPNTGRKFDATLVKGILDSAAKIAPVRSLMYKELTELAAEEIGGLLAAYESDEATQSPASKAVHLADLGNVIATAVTQDEFPATSEIGHNAKDFIGQVVSLFRAAGANAEQTGGDDELSISGEGGVTHNAIEAVSQLLFINSEASKEILEIAYGIAIKEDAGSSMDRDDSRRRDVVSAITDSAERLSTNRFEKAFELFALAHRYQRDRMSKHTERTSSGLLHINARGFLDSIKGRGVPKLSMATMGQEAFIEYAAEVARSNNSGHEVEDLKALQRFTENDRELNEIVTKQLEAAQAEHAAQQRPKSETERRVQELLA